MKLAIVGSRSFNNYEKLRDEIIKTVRIDDIECIISGGAKGADTLADRFAKSWKIPIITIPAQWITHGRAAGIIRNEQIVHESDWVIAFWDGVSRGTKSTIKFAIKAKKKLTIIKV